MTAAEAMGFFVNLSWDKGLCNWFKLHCSLWQLLHYLLCITWERVGSHLRTGTGVGPCKVLVVSSFLKWFQHANVSGIRV